MKSIIFALALFIIPMTAYGQETGAIDIKPEPPRATLQLLHASAPQRDGLIPLEIHYADGTHEIRYCPEIMSMNPALNRLIQFIYHLVQNCSTSPEFKYIIQGIELSDMDGDVIFDGLNYIKKPVKENDND